MLIVKSRPMTMRGIPIVLTILGVASGVLLLFFSPDLPVFVDIDYLEIVGGENDTLNIVLTLTMNSDIGISASVRELEYSISINDSTQASGRWSGDMSIPEHGEFQIDIPVSVHENMIPLWINTFSNSEDVRLLIDGNFTVNVFSLNHSSSFSETEQVSFDGLLDKLLLREAIRLNPKILDIASPSLSLRSSSVDVEMEFSNAYSFPISITSYVFDLDINDSTIGTISEFQQSIIPPGESIEQTSAITVNHFSPFAAAFCSIISREISYGLMGTINVEIGDVEIELPITKQGSFSIGFPGFGRN